MSAWGKSRRNFIVFIISAIILLPIFVIILNIYIEEPSCFDGKQNGDENGVDCGGSCSIFCSQQVIDPIVHWQRFFEVSPGIYNVVAYVENQNTDAVARNVEYMFELVDKDNVVLDSRRGRIDLRPREIIPIINTNLNTGKLKPARVRFDFVDDVIWHKGDIKERVLLIQNENQFEVDGLPRISAEVINTSVQTVNDISIIIIVYDEKDNAMSVSSTFLEAVNKDESKTINFTWPYSFHNSIGRFEIIPLYENNL